MNDDEKRRMQEAAESTARLVRELRLDLDEANLTIHEYEDERRARLEASRKETSEALHRADRTAKDWPDALRQNAALFAVEARTEFTGPGDVKGYFEGARNACQRALVHWTDLDLVYQEELHMLLGRLADLERQERETVANLLEAEAPDGHPGWMAVVRALRAGDPDEFLNW